LGIKSGFKTTAAGTIIDNEIVEELGVVMKRLEYLE